MKNKDIDFESIERNMSVHSEPDVLMEEFLDDLEMEGAVDWFLEHLNSDQGNSDGKHVYSTSLFSMTVDYSSGTAVISAELGCHPGDEVLDLRDLSGVLASRLAQVQNQRRQNRGGHAVPYRTGHEFRHDVLPS